MDEIQIFKGNIIYSVSLKEIITLQEGYVIVNKGKVEEILEALPEQYMGNMVRDFGNKLIIPGFCDMHIHAPQLGQRGLGMDKKLIEWLETYTFKNEARFSDISFAKEVYSRFADELVRNGSLCSCIFSTIHKPTTELLFDILYKKGLKAFIGKVNMDRNCPPLLMEDTSISLKETEELIAGYSGNRMIRPILTPRFVPTCSDALMDGLGKIAAEYGTPIQSHLAENTDEVAWVGRLHPDMPSYSHVYNSFGLFGHTPTLMAHCIHLSDEEISLMKDNNVTAVFCPDSNLNITSGIMPARKYIDGGISVVLGTDVGGGHNISMAKAIVSSIQVSKVSSMFDPGLLSLNFEEAFFMATKGGGSFFGNTGSFGKGYCFDALVIDDTSLGDTDLSLNERLQRFVYIGDDRNITERYVEGCQIG